jgi:hypothetical protein
MITAWMLCYCMSTLTRRYHFACDPLELVGKPLFAVVVSYLPDCTVGFPFAHFLGVSCDISLDGSLSWFGKT